MTLLPSENWNVQSRDDLPAYKVGPLCCVPGCPRPADHAHHLWRRSFGTRDAWVELLFLDPPVIAGNLVGICWRHHNDVTENRAWIRFNDKTGLFVWMEKSTKGIILPGEGWENLGELAPQPPRQGDTESLHEHDDEDVCSKCGRRRKPKEELPPGEKRKRKSWTVLVPDDGEDGAEVLDTLAEGLAEKYGIDHYKSARKRNYHVLARALYEAITGVEA